MALTRRDLLKALVKPGGLKGLTISRGAALEPGGFVTEFRGLRRPSMPYAETADLQDAQTRNELVFACLAIKASTAQDPRLIVQQQQGKGEYEEVPNHPLRALLMRPNAWMTEADLMKAAMISWDVSNPRRAYFEKVYNGPILESIAPLNPACMRPDHSRTSGELIGYTYSDGQHRRDYSLDELIIRAAPAWYDPPPLVSALGSVESDTAQTDYIRAFFENGGVPAGFLKYSMPLNDTQRDDIRRKWLSRYGNQFGRQHDVGVLDASADYQEIGAQLDKLSSQTLRSVAESRICMVFGVPPLIVYAYVGLLRATYSNLSEAWAGFWDATMSPAFKEWRSFWTWALLPEFESERDIRSERVRLHYDLSAVAALQEDVDAAQKRARENWTAGGITLNEFRAAVGYAPRSGGDDVFAKPITITTSPAGASGVAGAGKERKDRDGATVAMLERRMEREVRSYLQSEYRAAVAAVRAE
jgi:HK97 family phage portal protein